LIYVRNQTRTDIIISCNNVEVIKAEAKEWKEALGFQLIIIVIISYGRKSSRQTSGRRHALDSFILPLQFLKGSSRSRIFHLHVLQQFLPA
jgi:hypothetical protein